MERIIDGIHVTIINYIVCTKNGAKYNGYMRPLKLKQRKSHCKKMLISAALKAIRTTILYNWLDIRPYCKSNVTILTTQGPVLMRAEKTGFGKCCAYVF